VSSDIPTGGTTATLVGRGEHPPAGLLVGGRYRIISELGGGAFGAVSLAEDESTGHRVAIRFFPRRLCQASGAARAVRRMGHSIVAASSTHPVLTRVLEFGEIDDGRPFAIMERVEGRRLGELTSKGKQPDVATAMRLALDLGGSLEILHNAGFVHGAVCPHNIMMLADGRLKLLDIELAGLRDASELQGVIAPTPPAEYLAPEQISRAPVDEKADTYAFGAVLYELLCGAPPFRDVTREGVLAKHLKEAPAPIRARRRDAPRWVERAVMLALTKRPELRPLLGDLLNILWAGAHSPPPGGKRIAGTVAAASLAAVTAGAVTWGVLALSPWVPASSTPTARPAPEPPPQSVPPGPTLPARSHTVVAPTSPAPSPRAVERAPAVSPRPSPGLVIEPRPASESPAPMVRARAPASPSAPSGVERREPTRTPSAATTASPARPAAVRDPDDPGAVIDWLLNPSSRP
jgi:eukaryotic-like serine/threonine-protein kinase